MKKTKYYAYIPKKQLVKSYNAWQWKTDATVRKPIYVDDSGVPHFKYDGDFHPIKPNHFGHKYIDLNDNPVYYDGFNGLGLMHFPKLDGAKYKITLTLVDADDDDADIHVDDKQPSKDRFDDSVIHTYSAYNYNK
jgi:hypothetical protein